MATFFQLLGVTTADQASELWPGDHVQPGLGATFGDEAFPELMTYLQSALTFRAIRPGAAQPGLDADAQVTVGFTAELHVTPPPGPPGPAIALAQMSKIGYRLEPTGDVPAHVFVTQSAGGMEVVLHGLPVTILLPPGFIMPKRDQGDGTPLPDVRVAPPPPPDGPIVGFDPDRPDSLEIVLSSEGPSYVRVRVNVRMTELGDFAVDPVVPISFGECLFSGLPMMGLHDLQIVPEPAPQGVAPEHVDAELPLEWKRHRLNLVPQTRGLLTLRTLDLDMAAKPWKLIADKIKAKRPAADPVEFVLEDAAIPILNFPFPPIVVHARVGLRRQLLAGNAGGENYNLQDAPVDLEVGPLMIRLFRVLLQTTDLEGEMPVAFDAVIQRAGDPPAATRWSFPLSFSEDGVLTFGVVLPVADRLRLFTAFGREVRIAGARVGFSLTEVKKLFQGDGSAADAFLVLVDLELRKDTGQGGDKGPAAIAPKAGESTSMYFEGLGYRLGKPALGGIYNPTKLQLLLFNKFPLHIEEIGFVTEDNGGFYFSVSARLEDAFGPADQAPSETPPPPPQTTHGPCARTSVGRAEALKRGIGLRVQRLRTRIGGNEDAPRFMLDGLTLFVSIGRAELSGFGALAEFDLGGSHYQEAALGIQVCFPALGKHWDLGFQMYRGRVTGAQEFTYWMFAAVIGGVPLGSAELSGLRAIVVKNLAPRLPPADGTDQPMRLYRWYKENLGAVELPQHRALTAWAPKDHSSAWGAAATVTFAGTKAVRLHGFFFMMHGPDDAGFVAGLELYVLKAPKPIAFAAFEWDDKNDKWGLTIGFSVGLEALFGNIADVLSEITFAGLLFFGNKPDTLAIGQYNDTATWPSVRLNLTRFWKLEVFVGFCYHRVDAADALDPTTESIRVCGLIVSAKGGVKKSGIGTFQIYFTLSCVAGQWRNEAISTGKVIVFEAGVRIRLFGCFNFGASVKVDHAVLGPAVISYRRTSTVIRIETPWWLPDVTVRWESTDGVAVSEVMQVLTRPLVRAEAFGPGPRAPVAIGVAGVDAEDPPVVYSFDEARAIAAPAVSDDAFAALHLIGCDSEIALDFKVSLDASATVLPPTPAGAGRQDSEELSVTYEIVSIGIRRRRRHGDAAGAWADLVDPLTTELEPLFGLPPSQWQAHFQSAVGFDWDADVQRIDRLDPRRLLLNAVTPYSFLTGDPAGDEVIAETQPGWPCCTPERPRPRWHVVHFADTQAGTRTPATEAFTDSTSTLHWVGTRPPIVVPPASAPAGSQVALIAVDEHAEGVIACASFDQPVRICEVHAYWSPAHSHAVLVVEGFRGLARVASRAFVMSLDDPGTPIRFDEALGLTSLVIRKIGRPAASGDKGSFVELVMIRYRTLADERRALVDRARCDARDDYVHGQGRLAWLPNTDYEVTVRTRAVLGYTRTGEQEAFVEQKAYFRTKGLPGLNAVARVGEELEPYVESVYPPPGTTLYRTEPLAVAFDERFSILAPVDRTPSPGDPLERQTMMRWCLALEKAGGDGLERVSATSPDWIVEHRTSPLPLPPRRPAIFDTVLTTPVRVARSLDPLSVRLDRMIARPGGCGEPGTSLSTSQVLVHAPYDPERPDAARPRWEAGREYRVNLRLEHGPFVDRAPFVAEDAGAVSGRTEQGAGAAWTFESGAMLAPVTTTAQSTAQFAVFGDADWDHVQIVAGVEPDGAATGIATGVRLSSAGAVARAIVTWVDDRQGTRLRLEKRVNGAAVDSREVLLPDNTPRPFVVEITVYDDVVRANVAGSAVEVDRDGFREGHMALASLGGGRVTRLSVTALDGYRAHFTASRYDDFAAHIGSHDGSYGVVRPGDLGAPATSVAALLAETSSEISAAMTVTADSAPRERLFARWVSGLALPLRTAPERLSITRYEVAGATGLLIIESPEPLPLGGDVSLVLRKRRRIVPPFPRPPRPAPPIATARRARASEPLGDDVASWTEALELDHEEAVGAAPPLPPALAGLQRLVRAVADDEGRTAYRMYTVRRGTRPGDPVAIVPVAQRATEEIDEALRTLAVGDLALLDARNRFLIPPFPSPLPPVWVDVPLRILADASGCRALAIPVGANPSTHAPLATGTYRIIFSIDRPRWRAEVPDAASSYQASVTLAAAW